jgi:cell division protein FtsN
MAKKRRRKKQSSSQSAGIPAWASMLFGLAVGLSVALAIFLNDRKPREEVPSAAPEPASVRAENRAIDSNGEAEETEDEEPRFAFYDMLPNFEGVIPEDEPDVSVDVEPKAIDQPGLYVLQAGSFTAFADADRRRAELALQGIESRVQRVSIDDRTFHRVRIGPTRDLDELNVLRARLRTAKIDVLRIRLGD